MEADASETVSLNRGPERQSGAGAESEDGSLDKRGSAGASESSRRRFVSSAEGTRPEVVGFEDIQDRHEGFEEV